MAARLELPFYYLEAQRRCVAAVCSVVRNGVTVIDQIAVIGCRHAMTSPPVWDVQRLSIDTSSPALHTRDRIGDATSRRCSSGGSPNASRQHGCRPPKRVAGIEKGTRKGYCVVETASALHRCSDDERYQDVFVSRLFGARVAPDRSVV